MAAPKRRKTAAKAPVERKPDIPAVPGVPEAPVNQEEQPVVQAAPAVAPVAPAVQEPAVATVQAAPAETTPIPGHEHIHVAAVPPAAPVQAEVPPVASEPAPAPPAEEVPTAAPVVNELLTGPVLRCLRANADLVTEENISQINQVLNVGGRPRGIGPLRRNLKAIEARWARIRTVVQGAMAGLAEVNGDVQLTRTQRSSMMRDQFQKYYEDCFNFDELCVVARGHGISVNEYEDNEDDKASVIELILDKTVVADL